MNKILVSLFITLVFILNSCSVETKPIAFGHDHCAYCKMGISDDRFGAELLTKKGRDYKFDDLYCMKEFLEDSLVAKEDVHSMWVIDFSKPEKLINVTTGYLLRNEELKSPMGSNIAAFESKESLDEYFSQYAGQILTWEEYLNAK